ncbi:N-acetyltransferase [Coleophoma crateriformis]|uniref:N-acetyltransferase n=1 Tax=Coleophoma crateriformis TaxID=565419 RepID=A0A3D8R320_9HELO|nr:N-acetyltransferase [Coleophoma crateriformis]
MIVNENTAISTSSVLLVPYEASHVTTYHDWMKDAEIQEATASEPLTLPEEYAMQHSWRLDHDKLTFIACKPLSDAKDTTAVAGICDEPESMLGDVNLFLSPADEDEEGCIGELELMIAPVSARRKGYGRSTILAFMMYIESHLDDILAEYKNGLASEQATAAQGKKMNLLQLKVKIGSKNAKSITLFESIGFVKIEEGENYFGEIELVFEGFLGQGRVKSLLEKFGVGDFRELPYERMG